MPIEITGTTGTLPRTGSISDPEVGELPHFTPPGFLRGGSIPSSELEKIILFQEFTPTSCPTIPRMAQGITTLKNSLSLEAA